MLSANIRLVRNARLLRPDSQVLLSFSQVFDSHLNRTYLAIISKKDRLCKFFIQVFLL